MMKSVNVLYILCIHAFITLELLKIIEVHKNVGLCPESQVDGQHVSGTNKAHLAFEVCVRPPTSACGSNRAMDAKRKKKEKKQDEAMKRSEFASYLLKPRWMPQPALGSDVLISGTLIMNTLRAFGEVTTATRRKKTKRCKMSWWMSGKRWNTTALLCF